MKKKKGKIIALAAMLCVLGVLVGATFALKHYNKVQEEEKNKDTSVVVIDKSSLTVTSAEITTKAGRLSFSYVNDEWVYDDDEHFPVNQEKLSDIAQTLSKISASVEIAPDRQGTEAEYGLDAPGVRAVATFSDGTSVTYLFGDINSYKNCQYLSVSGDDNVYLTETSVAETLAAKLDDLCRSEAFPLTADGIKSTDVKEITLKTADGKTNTVNDSDGIDELLGYVKVLNLTSRATYYANAEDMSSEYGIDASSATVTVNYVKSTTYTDEDGNDYTGSDDVSYTLRIGKSFVQSLKEADGTEGSETCCYYSPEGSDMVYYSDSASVGAVFDFIDYVPGEGSGAAEED